MENTENLQQDDAYRLASALLQALREDNPAALQASFGISPAILDEIDEELALSALNRSSLTMAPPAEAQLPRRQRMWFELHAMNEPAVYRAEITLFANGKDSELTLLLEYREDKGKLACRFLRLGSN